MTRALLAWTAAAALFGLYALAGEGPREEPGNQGPVRKLFGPFARLAAQVQWIRFDRARLAGRGELALAHADAAIDLDPADARGWELYATHLALNLASAEREPDPARRRAWVEAALAVAAEGEAVASDPASLAFLQGFLLHVKAENDPELGWPGGAEAMWSEAARHYERAARLGHPAAAAAAAYALAARERELGE